MSTAPVREKIELNDKIIDVMAKVAEGNLDASTILAHLVSMYPTEGIYTLLTLNDMNMRGPQIVVAYKDFCKEDLAKFKEVIDNRSQEVVDVVNSIMGHYATAVTHGASFNARS
jgi:hypothetical protein